MFRLFESEASTMSFLSEQPFEVLPILLSLLLRATHRRRKIQWRTFKAMFFFAEGLKILLMPSLPVVKRTVMVTLNIPFQEFNRYLSQAIIKCSMRHLSSCSFPTRPKSLLTPHKVNLHFGDLVPPLPDQADVSRSLRGWWWWGAGNFCWQKGDDGATCPPLLVLGRTDRVH